MGGWVVGGGAEEIGAAEAGDAATASSAATAEAIALRRAREDLKPGILILLSRVEGEAS